MIDQIISMLMTFILMILSIFGGTGDITKPEEDGENADADAQVSYTYTINDEYYEFKNLQYGESSERNILDLYVPRTNTKCEMGLVLYIHGGGWILNDKDSTGYSNAAKNYALSNGYACAAINYSYLSEDVNMYDLLDDITDALTAISAAGNQVAVTIDKTILYGYSAGAHLSLLYAYSMADVAPIEPVAVVSFAGPTNLSAEEYWTTATDIKDNYNTSVPDGSGRNALSYILSCAVGESINSYADVQTYSEELLAVSPVDYVKTAVPTILVHGKKDVTVPYENATELDSLLTASNIKHQFISYDNYGHEVGAEAAVIEEVNTYLASYASEYLVSVADKMDIPEPFEFTYLEYPAEAVKTIADNNTTVATLTARANKNNDDLYGANQGYSDVNGVVISPYYTASVDGTKIPVYASLVYSEETNGALHSFSEIYITDDMADNKFEIKLNSADLRIKDAVYMTTNEKVSATVSGGVMTAELSGCGIYTFLINSESQAYAYTLFVREEVDEDAEIQALRDQGYTVDVYSGIVEFNANSIYYYDITGASNYVIYLRRGTYITAGNKQDITSDATLYTEASDCAGIGGLQRHPLIGGSGTTNVKILSGGGAVVDFTDLDRMERKGLVFSWGSNIELRGLKLVNGAEWGIQTYRINGVTISDVDVFGYRLNSDAFDICNSQNVTVSNCFARSGDDLFAVKTLGSEDVAACYSTNIEITDCVAWAGKARPFGISGEAYLDINNVTFKDCAVICHDATWGEYNIAAIGIMVDECGQRANTISNVTFENIRIFRNESAAFSLYVAENVGYGVTMSNITFKNVYYDSNDVKSKAWSTKDGTTIQATLNNVYCGTKKLVGSDYPTYIDTTSNINLAFY
ncbi:MAG: alpha/beta hydrolase fold domain-containing protein [Clostridia bacterium]|nr:alpha/beta hydrolase fold domain-containing protein [Clostridia bacterium]